MSQLRRRHDDNQNAVRVEVLRNWAAEIQAILDNVPEAGLWVEEVSALTLIENGLRNMAASLAAPPDVDPEFAVEMEEYGGPTDYTGLT